MKPLPIGEDFPVFEKDGTSLLMGSELMALDALGFDGSPNGFHQSVIPTIPFATHAHRHPLFNQESTIGAAGVLTATIRMMQEVSANLPSAQGHLQSRFNPCLIPSGTHGPPNDQARIAIDKASHIKPSLLGPDSRAIAHPFFAIVAMHENPSGADSAQLAVCDSPHAMCPRSHGQSCLPPSRVRRACDHNERPVGATPHARAGCHRLRAPAGRSEIG